jgi:hypothetical protein
MAKFVVPTTVVVENTYYDDVVIISAVLHNNAVRIFPSWQEELLAFTLCTPIMQPRDINTENIDYDESSVDQMCFKAGNI